MPRISTILAQPITLTTTTTVGVVVDAYATRTVTLAAGVYRIFLAPSGGVGTEASPFELLSALKDACDASTGGADPYSFSLTASGFVRLLYSGAGTTSITWHAGLVIRNLLGFSTDVSAALSSTAPYHPTHVVYSEGRETDSGWIVQPGKQPAALTRGGRVYARDDGARRVVRKIKFGPLPELWEHRDLASGLGVECSCALPDDTTRLLAPSDSAGLAPPWSWSDFVHSCGGKKLGVALGNFQELRATPGTYETAYLHPDTISGDSEQGLLSDDYRIARWQSATLSLQGVETQ